MDTWGSNVRQLEQESNRIEADEDKILRELARLHERMDSLEKQLLDKK